MSLIGLDVGTTGCKAIVVNLEGKVLGEAYREYPLTYPQPGWAELDPDEVFDKVQVVLKEAVERAQGADPVQGIGISSQGEAGIPVDADGNFLYRSPVSFDTRAVPQTERLGERHGRERIFEITGHALNGMYTLPKIEWLIENVPAVRERMERFYCFEDYIIFRLCGHAAIDYSLAARTLAFDINTKTWSTEMLADSPVDASVFAEPMPSGSVAGTILPEVARSLGLPADTKIVTGGHDQPCGALGAGIIRPHVAVDGTGTVECITAAFPEPVLTPTMRENGFSCYPAVAPDLYVTLAYNFTGGSLLRWYRDTLGQAEVAQARAEGRDVYNLLISKATDGVVQPMVLPHFTATGTPHHDPISKGAILGLALETTAGDIIKAVLDGVTFEMKLNLSLLDQAGVRIDVIRAIGGGSRSPVWLQLKADMFRRPVVRLDVEEAPCLGAALCAGVATGAYGSFQEAVDAAVHEGDRYEPNNERADQYDERFAIYRDLYPALADINHRL
jgi:xylulokinase